ncbi:MAG: hypothetical protein A7316_06205 [Candidatus Altiarchaeales archaeon WOR_SM1_86-2]|nr:MAG: hypothetical protein A7316_06205 [Candidatus Altiarchaeales archaeon WOR_SM1_86-2]ODS41627.1 MAG: hypothetical protein A7315_00975 [Candidatus Altiarchaeales archaeon WOR_SM1_79]
MKCFYHPTADAVMTCSSCGKGLCKDCVVQKNEKGYCRQCDVQSQGGLDAVEAIAIIFGSVCLSPVMALVVWLIWRDSKPEKAKQSGYICIGIAVLYIVLIVLYFLFIAAMIGSDPYLYDY